MQYGEVDVRKSTSGTNIVRFSQTRRDLLRAALVAPVFASGLLDAARAFAQGDAQIAPFTYRASQSALDDLRRRLTNTRWPEKETVNDWSQGVPLAEIRALVDYWRDEYDWRRAE